MAWRCRDHSTGPAAAANVVIDILTGNDPVAREICLHNKSLYGTAPAICDALMNSIDGALALGTQGPELDAWHVLEAAERFKEVIVRVSDKIPTSCEFPAFAIINLPGFDWRSPSSGDRALGALRPEPPPSLPVRDPSPP